MKEFHSTENKYKNKDEMDGSEQLKKKNNEINRDRMMFS